MSFLRHLSVPAQFANALTAATLSGMCSALLVPSLLTTALATTALATTVLAQAAIASPMLVSWYGPGFEGGYTANGEIFSRYGHTAAHPSWPFNTLVQLTHPNTGAVVTVRINDRSGGSLDISEQAARDLGTYSAGIASVNVEILQWGE